MTVMKSIFTCGLLILGAGFTTMQAQELKGKIVINTDLGEKEISRHIYGHCSG